MSATVFFLLLKLFDIPATVANKGVSRLVNKSMQLLIQRDIVRTCLCIAYLYIITLLNSDFKQSGKPEGSVKQKWFCHGEISSNYYQKYFSNF